MNDLQIYIYSGTQLRTIEQADGLWWVLKDVCGVLGLSNPGMTAKRLDDDEKAEVSLTYTSSNRVQQSRVTTIINEPGLYAVILRSDKPEAHDFKRWVTHEVLPSIRKTGSYTTEQMDALAKARSTVAEWESLADQFNCYTQAAGRKAHAAREEYDHLRKSRDSCRLQLALSRKTLDGLLSSLIEEHPQ